MWKADLFAVHKDSLHRRSARAWTSQLDLDDFGRDGAFNRIETVAQQTRVLLAVKLEDLCLLRKGARLGPVGGDIEVLASA